MRCVPHMAPHRLPHWSRWEGSHQGWALLVLEAVACCTLAEEGSQREVARHGGHSVGSRHTTPRCCSTRPTARVASLFFGAGCCDALCDAEDAVAATLLAQEVCEMSAAVLAQDGLLFLVVLAMAVSIATRNRKARCRRPRPRRGVPPRSSCLLTQRSPNSFDCRRWSLENGWIRSRQMMCVMLATSLGILRPPARNLN